MITTLVALVAVCLLSLAFILIIPYFAATKVLMRFLPQDIREAAKAHPDHQLRAASLHRFHPHQDPVSGR